MRAHHSTALLLVALAGCQADTALRLTLQIVETRPDTCFEIQVGAPGGEVMQTSLEREVGKGEYEVVIVQGSLPREVRLQVTARVGCDGLANGTRSLDTAFPERGVRDVTLSLAELPDVDGDGAVDEAAGGADCDDMTGERSPFRAEVCDAPVDADCDGDAACDDADCASEPACAVRTLHLLPGDAGYLPGDCIPQRVDVVGGAPETITLSSSSAVAFSRSCGGEALGEFDGGDFWFRPLISGPHVITASAPGFVSASASYEVDSGAAVALHVLVDGGELMAAVCTPIGLSWRDERGYPAVPPPMTLSTDGGLIASSNATCDERAFMPAFDMTVYVLAPDEGDYELFIDGGTPALSATVPLTAVRPMVAGALQHWPLKVHTPDAGPFNGYEGYTLFADVDAGEPLVPDHSNLRVYFWDGGWQQLHRTAAGITGQDRVRVFFRSQTDLPNDFTDDRYALFVMDAGATAPLNDLREVYLFYDDFEEGGLARWHSDDDRFSIDGTRGYNSSHSLRIAPGDAGMPELFIEAALPKPERDVRIDARWFIEHEDVNVAQLVRVQPVSRQAHEYNLALGGGGLEWRGFITLDWTLIFPVIDAGVPLNEWQTVRVQMFRDTIQLRQAGTHNWSFDAGTSLDAGGVGFRLSPISVNPVWIDDVRVWRLIVPGPTVTVELP